MENYESLSVKELQAIAEIRLSNLISNLIYNEKHNLYSYHKRLLLDILSELESRFIFNEELRERGK